MEVRRLRRNLARLRRGVKPSPYCQSWLPKANQTFPNMTLPVVCRWAILRRRVPVTLSIHCAELAIPGTWLLHPPAYCAPVPILASIDYRALPIPDQRHRSQTGAAGPAGP